MAQNFPVSDTPAFNIFGLQVTNSGSNSDEIVNISAGRCRDNNNIVDIYVDSLLSVDNTLSGAGGLDIGTVAADTLYAVYVIADSTNYQPVVGLLSLATSNEPTLPFGYDSYRRIGYVATDATSDFLLFYQYGDGHLRHYYYRAQQATAVTAGNATAFTLVDLGNFVPIQENVVAKLGYSFVPASAGNTFQVTPKGTGNPLFTATGQVATVAVTGNVDVMGRLSGGTIEVDYRVSNGSDAVAIDVGGFIFTV